MGGSSGNTTSTVNQSNIPEYARPYYENVLSEMQKEMSTPYQAYGGTRIAPQNSQTVAGLNMLQKYAQSGMTDLNNARSLTNLVGQQAIEAGNYESGYTGQYAPGQFAADQVGVENFDASARDQYMSPYMDAVVAASQRDAQQKALEEQAYLRAQQGTAGAFGGSRAAVQNQIALNEAQKRISDIGVQGRQAAFENAQQQFNTDQSRRVQAEMANQGADLQAAGMGESSRQFSEQAKQQAEQLRQGGEQIGLQGLQIAGATAGQLADMQRTRDELTMQRARAQMGVGQFQEAYTQRLLDQRYEDFLNQRDYGKNQIGWASGILHGVPVGQNTTSTTSQSSDPVAGGVGSLIMWNAYNNLWGGSQPAAKT